jgi:oligopeptide transport system substrate-binding protein
MPRLSANWPLLYRPRTKRFLVCAALSLFAALQSACSKSEKPTASASPTTSAAPQILRISQRNEPSDLDPATATLPDEFFILRALSEGLLVPDTANTNRGEPLPAAAERFTVSPDGLTHTFHLRPTATWSDGSPVTAADFLASYRRALTPATAAPKAHLFYAVKNARAFLTGAVSDFSLVGFDAPDPHTLVISLAQPTPSFPHYVASGPWLPTNSRAIAQHGRTWTQPGHFIGNGPFTLTEWRQQQRIVGKKNPRYRAAATVRLDEIQFLRFDSGDTEERAYRAGQVDVTMSVPFTKIETYTRDRPAEFHRAAAAETRFLSFNTTRPALADARVRRALSLAINRPQIVERITRGGQPPATAFLPPSLVGPALVAVPSRDAPAPRAATPAPTSPDAPTARALLVDAGFPAGKNFPRLELTAWSPSQSPVLEAIQAMWRTELGIEVSIVIHEAKVHHAALASGTYDIAFATTAPMLDLADPVALLANFTTTGANNYPRWHHAPFDALLAAATTAPDATRQSAFLAEAESLLTIESPVAPLYFNTRTWLMSPRVRDWREDPLWSRDYTAVHLAP